MCYLLVKYPSNFPLLCEMHQILYFIKSMEKINFETLSFYIRNISPQNVRKSRALPIFNTRAEVYLVVHLSNTFLSVTLTWNSIKSGKLEITTIDCPINYYYGQNLLYIVQQIDKLLLDTSHPDDCVFNI